MKVYYVDAENVGFNLPTELSISVLDRVFVFTNNEKHIKDCKDSLLTIVSGYPTEANQADFHIIAHFVKIACHLSPVEKKALVFILCSKDVNLWKAFEFQCTLVGVKSSNPFIDVVTEEIKAFITAPEPVKVTEPSPVKTPEVKKITESVNTKVLNLLRVEAFSAAEITKKLKVTKELTAKSLNELIQSKQIQRVSKSKKKWCVIKLTPVKATEVKKITGSVVTKEIAMTKIVNLLRVEAFSAAEITEKLKIETKLVAASLSELFRQKKIQRVSEGNKKWCLIKLNPASRGD